MKLCKYTFIRQTLLSRLSPSKGGDPAAGSPTATLLRLHPNHHPYLRCPPPKRLAKTTLGTNSSHGVTGGVYKVRERIHRAVADARLLAISTSWGRVADPNLNLDRLYGVSLPLQVCSPLYRPL